MKCLLSQQRLPEAGDFALELRILSCKLRRLCGREAPTACTTGGRGDEMGNVCVGGGLLEPPRVEMVPERVGVARLGARHRAYPQARRVAT